MLATRQDLRRSCVFRAQDGTARMVAHAVMSAVAPYPVLVAGPAASDLRRERGSLRMSPDAGLGSRAPPVWTEADNQMADRFPWHATLTKACATGLPVFVAYHRELFVVCLWSV